MATSLSNLSSLLSSPYAQSALQGVSPRDPEPLKAGTSVTARYTVDEDGALALKDVSINEPQDDGQGKQSSKRFNAQDNAQNTSATLASLARPKPTISPSDEVALFAGYGGDLASQPAGADTQLDNNVHDAVYEELTPDGEAKPQASAQPSLGAQKQQSVANLYARNADAVYNVDPILSEAA